MEDKKFCESCNQNKSCRKAYEQIGSIKGPSIAFKVITALLIPLMVFIGSLIASDMFFNRFIVNENLKTFFSIFVASVITFFVIVVIKIATKTQRHEEKYGDN